ncbi:MAG: hydrolase, partial [Acidobacteria bacterium]|nr:hydrolase [Acidobacteriota bacterium]
PEKRPFFLENAGTFAVGKAQTVDLFFSRRIGIDSSLRPVPIVAGARLSGKVGGFNVGFLNMQTDDTANVVANNFTVARVNRELPNRSNLGAIFLNRTAAGFNASPRDWNRTWGIDGKFGVGEHLTLNGFTARTETPGRTGPEHAYNVRGEYQRRAGRIYAEYVEVGNDFNPEVGFLQRKDYRNIELGAYANVRAEGLPWLREWRPHMTYESFWDFAGFQESDRYHMSAPLDFARGASISPSVNVTLEGLKEDFEIHPGIKVPPGLYRNTELALRANTNRSAAFYAGAEMDFGGFLSGNQRSFGIDGGARKGSLFSSSVRWRRNDIRLREGNFETDLIQWRFNWNFTPLTYLQYLVQYNNSIDTFSANIRFGVLNTAGTGLFLVYNEGRSLDGFAPLTRTFILKYTRQFDIMK